MSNWKRMANSVIQIFGNDGTLDNDELDYLMNLALENGVIDEQEKKVLQGIFAQVSEDTVKPEVWAKIQEIRKKYSI